MEVKKLDKNETVAFKELIEIFNDVFENEREIPNYAHLHQLLSDPKFIVFVIKLQHKVIGGATVYILHQYYSVRPLAYIYDVGIAKHFQGQGFGKALMAEVCTFCKVNGCEAAYVEAENDDVDAVDFYRKTRYSSEMAAMHFTYSFTDDSRKHE